MKDPRIIIPLDYPNAQDAESLVARLSPSLCSLKVGKELFTAAGPRLVNDLVIRGFKVFLDLKFHDIPNTVAQACLAAARLNVWMLTLHIAGGRAMLTAARKAIDQTAVKPWLLGVTVLTSLTDQDLQDIGIQRSIQEQVLALAQIADECQLDGLVCSAQEAKLIRQTYGARFKLITPGIRTEQSQVHDQARTTTPQAAIKNGADYLVIGRSITRSADPLAALLSITDSIKELT